MKRIYWFLISAAAITLLILLFSYINRDRMMDKMMEMAINRSTFKKDLLDDLEGIRVFTLGTASALPDDYNQTGTAVFVGGKFFLFDVGDGVVKEAETQRLPLPLLDAVFISHWHSDHYIELPHVINRTWQLGRQNQLEIYGPNGIDSILGQMDRTLAPEIENRITHHGDSIMSRALSGAIPHAINSNGTSSTVYNQDGIRITAFEVCHPPITPSYGFKLEYDNKTLVISGDTKEDCPNLESFAQNADLLIHEAMLKDIFIKSSELNDGNGNSRNAKIAKDITEYHTSPVDIGKLATRANVKSLVLHHFAPVPSNIILKRRYRAAIRQNYLGPLSLAEDGEEFYIE